MDAGNKLTNKKLKAILGKEIAKPAIIADGRGLSIQVSQNWSILINEEL